MLQIVVALMIAYGCIGTVWEDLENALYGYSQHSAVDAVVAWYLAYRLVTLIWRHTSKGEEDDE